MRAARQRSRRAIHPRCPLPVVLLVMLLISLPASAATRLTLVINHLYDGKPLVFDSTTLTNAAGEQISVTRLRVVHDRIRSACRTAGRSSPITRTPSLDPNLGKHPDTGLNLSATDRQALVAFLKSLTDEQYQP